MAGLNITNACALFSYSQESECVGPANYYAGQRMCTTTGIACQRWSSQNPHKHNFTNGAMFPEKSVTAAAAYCRDPNNIHGNPWCFTQDSNITWEYCDIPKCEGNILWIS